MTKRFKSLSLRRSVGASGSRAAKPSPPCTKRRTHRPTRNTSQGPRGARGCDCSRAFSLAILYFFFLGLLALMGFFFAPPGLASFSPSSGGGYGRPLLVALRESSSSRRALSRVFRASSSAARILSLSAFARTFSACGARDPRAPQAKLPSFTRRACPWQARGSPPTWMA